MAYLRELGCCAAIVERKVPYSFVSQDLLGCIDVLAIRTGVILGIQATSGSNHSARISKSLAEPRLRLWLEAGGRFEVWSFSKKGPRGKKKKWLLRTQKIKLNEHGRPEACP